MLSTFADQESALSVRTKINASIDKVNELDAASGATGIDWTANNTLTRVTAAINSLVYTFVIKTGGNVSINPAGGLGAQNWEVENRGILPLNSSIGPYLQVGQLVSYDRKIYSFIGGYNGLPTTNNTGTSLTDTSLKYYDVILAQIEAADGGGSGGNGGTGGTGGTQTTSSFMAYDAGNLWYEEDGTAGQLWSVGTTIFHTGAGYITTNGFTATLANAAIAWYRDIDYADTVARKMWVRAYSPIANSTFGIQSQGTGQYSTLTIPTANTWVWLEMAQPFAAFDRQIKVTGLSPNVIIDAFMLTETANTDVPTGENGFTT